MVGFDVDGHLGSHRAAERSAPVGDYGGASTRGRPDRNYHSEWNRSLVRPPAEPPRVDGAASALRKADSEPAIRCEEAWLFGRAGGHACRSTPRTGAPNAARV